MGALPEDVVQVAPWISTIIALGVSTIAKFHQFAFADSSSTLYGSQHRLVFLGHFLDRLKRDIGINFLLIVFVSLAASVLALATASMMSFLRWWK